MSRRIDIADLSPAYQEQVRQQLARAKPLVVTDIAAKPGSSKYRSTKVALDGMTFDSKFEAKRYLEFKAMQESGLIECLEVHKSFALHVLASHGHVRIGAYEADFVYRRDRELYVEDTKSVMTRRLPLYAWKRKHFEFEYGLQVIEVVSRAHRKRQ